MEGELDRRESASLFLFKEPDETPADREAWAAERLANQKLCVARGDCCRFCYEE